jgi:drug/metabolite transporter (DMT)-like permease
MAELADSRSSRAAAYAGLTASIAFWGASFVATKLLLREWTPPVLVTVRFVIGTAVLALTLLVRGSLRLPRRDELAALALLGFLGITVHQWLQATGLQTAAASVSSWIVATTPIFVALLGWTILRERLTAARGLGIAVAAGGMAIVISRGDLSLLVSGASWLPGDGLILLSAVNWAVFTVLSKRLIALRPADDHRRDRPVLLMFYVLALGLLFSFPWLGVQGFGESTWPLTTQGWLSLMVLGVGCSGLAYIFWYTGLEAIDATQVGSFLYLEPIVTTLVAYPILGEPVSVSLVTGGAAILFGLWLVNRTWARRGE